MIVSFYDKSTGLFTGRSFSGPHEALALNTAADEGAIVGRFDHLSQRVDLETGQVIDYQPPSPSDDHAWHAASKRWVLKREVQEAIAADGKARGAIAKQEQLSLRAIRELLLDPQNKDARARLQSVESAIAAARVAVRPKTGG